MHILVVDDNATNGFAALEQLKEHDVKLASNYDDAQRLLGGEWWSYFDGKYAGEEEAAPKPHEHNFEVVLVDLLMPADCHWAIDQDTPGWKFRGQEMPLGIFLALLAAVNGAKYVAIFTDSHHNHPASACFDTFNNGGEGEPVPLTVNEAKMILCNNRDWI